MAKADAIGVVVCRCSRGADCSGTRPQKAVEQKCGR